MPGNGNIVPGSGTITGSPNPGVYLWSFYVDQNGEISVFKIASTTQDPSLAEAEAQEALDALGGPHGGGISTDSTDSQNDGDTDDGDSEDDDGDSEDGGGGDSA